MQTSDWTDEKPVEVTVEAFDNFVKEYATKREEYEAAKKVSGDMYAIYQESENKLISLLKATGKKNYNVDGIGGISLVTKEVVTTPKTIEDKRSLFGWIKEKYGVDVLDDMVSINHQKLNGFYNQEAEKSTDAMFHIPGLESPTMTESLSFRRKK